MPDKRKSKMVEFSSEQEAVEYVREQEQEADREGCEYHECNKPGRKPRCYIAVRISGGFI